MAYICPSITSDILAAAAAHSWAMTDTLNIDCMGGQCWYSWAVGFVNGIIILWYMAAFIWLQVSVCHTTHNGQQQQQQHSAKYHFLQRENSAGIVFLSFQILTGKKKLTQLPKYCNSASHMCICQLPSRLQLHWLWNLSPLCISLYLVLQRIINFAYLKCIQN